MIDEQPLRKLDVVAGAGLGALGLAIIVRALRMPIGGTYGGVDNPWYASPAAMPLLLGTLLVGGAVAIIGQAVKRGGHRGLPAFLRTFGRDTLLTREAARAAGAWGGLLVYALALKFPPFAALAGPLERAGAPGWLAEPSGANYVLCSFLFLVAYILGFYRPEGHFPRAARIGVILVGSLGVALLVAHAFSELLRVPLP